MNILNTCYNQNGSKNYNYKDVIMKNHFNNFSYTQAVIQAPIMFPTGGLMAGAMANDSGKMNQALHLVVIAGLTTAGALIGLASLLAYPISIPTALAIDAYKGYQLQQKYKSITYDKFTVSDDANPDPLEPEAITAPENDISNSADNLDTNLNHFPTVNSTSVNRLMTHRFNELLESSRPDRLVTSHFSAINRPEQTTETSVDNNSKPINLNRMSTASTLV